MTGVGTWHDLDAPACAISNLKFRLAWRVCWSGDRSRLFWRFPPSIFLRDPIAAIQQKSGQVVGLSAGEAARTPQFWFLAFVFFALVCVPAGVIAHIVPILTDRGISPQIATSAISAAGAALVVGRLLAGYLLDRIFAPYVALFFILIPMVGLGLLFLPATPAIAVAATICVGLGLRAEVDLIAFMIARYFGFRSFGEIYGYLFAVFTFRKWNRSVRNGLVVQQDWNLRPAIVALAAGLLVSAFLVLLLGPYRYANLIKP